MTEISRQDPGLRLEASLTQLEDTRLKHPVRQFFRRLRNGNTDLLREEFSEISQLSRLFLKLFKEGGITASQPRSLNIVLPGGSYTEVTAAHFAANAFAIPRTSITRINSHPVSDKDLLSRVLLQEGETTDDGTTMQVGNSSIRMIQGDAALPTYKEQLPDADATVVFVGNCQIGMGDVVENWATLGKETEKPFLLAITATAEETKLGAEKELIGEIFKFAKEQGELVTVNGMEGMDNPYRFDFPGVFNHPRVINHDYLFAASRKKSVHTPV